jgi:uncharacterized membrane protein
MPGKDYPVRKSERLLSMILIACLSLAMLMTFSGGIIFLKNHGKDIPNYTVFKPELFKITHLQDQFEEKLSDSGLKMMQWGIIFLIATPMARVASCLVLFAFERDMLYTAISSILLMILLFSFFWKG